MNRRSKLATVVSIAIGLNMTLPAAPQSVRIDVHGPTVVAFFSPATKAELQKDSDLNESLADFQYYAASVGPQLRQRGIQFRTVYAHSFQVLVEAKRITVNADEQGVGYYLIAPGIKPLIETGVMTDSDLVQAADRYFNAVPR